MLSERKLAANRENAQRSTGPRTPEGKSICAQNASRHGKLADEVLLACEDRKQFIRYSRRYHREFQPVGHLEKSLVNDMVAASWRRDRLGVLEARLIDHSYNTIPEPLLPQLAPDAPAPHPDHSPVAFRNALGYRELVDTSKVLPQLSRDAARHNRDFHKALATLLRLRTTQAKIQATPPPADPEGTFPEDLMGLFGSVPTPVQPISGTPSTPSTQTESTTYESELTSHCLTATSLHLAPTPTVGWAILPAAGFQPAVTGKPAAPAPSLPSTPWHHTIQTFFKSLFTPTPIPPAPIPQTQRHMMIVGYAK